jgi:hypothetical protein
MADGGYCEAALNEQPGRWNCATLGLLGANDAALVGDAQGTVAVGIEAEGKGWKLRDIRITEREKHCLTRC